MDIKELKLLGGFNHPNIVRFVRVHSTCQGTRLTEGVHSAARREYPGRYTRYPCHDRQRALLQRGLV